PASCSGLPSRFRWCKRPEPPEAWPCSQPVPPQSHRVETQPGLGLPSEVACSDSLRRYRQRQFPHRSPVCVPYLLRIGLVPLGSRSRGCEEIPEIGAFSSFREFTPDHLFNDTRGEWDDFCHRSTPLFA